MGEHRPAPAVLRAGGSLPDARLPDRFVLHAERDEQLAEVGLDVDGIVRSALELAQHLGITPEATATADSRSAG